MVVLSMFAAGTFTPSACAQRVVSTSTALTVAVNNAGPRTLAILTAHVAAADPATGPQGVVNFRADVNTSSEMDLGSALLDGKGDAALDTALLAAGNHQVVAIYAGQPSYLGSASRTEQVKANVTTVAGYTVAASPTSLSTAAGGFVSANITVTPNNGFSAFVNLSCTGLPLNTTCSFNPVSVPAGCTTGAGGVATCPPTTSVMQIQTLAPSPGSTAVVRSGTGLPRYALLLPVLFGLAGLGAGKRRAWRNLALTMLAFAGAMAVTACAQRYDYLHHGPPDNIGSPLGNYTVTVQAQSSTGSETITPPSLPKITLAITP